MSSKRGARHPSRGNVFHAQPGGASWTPRPYAAPTSPVLPAVISARAPVVSIRARSNASSVTRATKPSAPPQARSSIGCAPRQKPSSSSCPGGPLAVPCKRLWRRLDVTSGRGLRGGRALVDRGRGGTHPWSNNHGTWDRCQRMTSVSRHRAASWGWRSPC